MDRRGFLTIAFIDNKWLWAHLVAAAILSRYLDTQMDKGHVLIVVLFLSVLWEVIESMSGKIEEKDGTRKAFFVDGVGDVLGALFMASIVIF